MLIGTALWLGFATVFVLWGAAWIVNWHEWADRWAAWNRRTWGPLALWSGSSLYNGASGFMLLVFGAVLYYGWLRWLIGQAH